MCPAEDGAGQAASAGYKNLFGDYFQFGDDERVLRVYLDQNKWVDLARAGTGHRLGARFADALAMAGAGVAAGTVSFPLDMYRYWETSKRATTPQRSRRCDARAVPAAHDGPPIRRP